MPEFVVAHILDDHHVGQRFTMWPLHVTVMPPFEAPDLDAVMKSYEPIVEQVRPIHMYLGGLARFGADTVVQKLVPSTELSMLHSNLMQAAGNQGWEVKGRYTGERFTPHITRKAGRLYRGAQFDIETLSVVEAQPQGYREVVSELVLQGVVR